jgi:hypothetical protein
LYGLSAVIQQSRIQKRNLVTFSFLFMMSFQNESHA